MARIREKAREIPSNVSQTYLHTTTEEKYNTVEAWRSPCCEHIGGSLSRSRGSSRWAPRPWEKICPWDVLCFHDRETAYSTCVHVPCRVYHTWYTQYVLSLGIVRYRISYNNVKYKSLKINFRILTWGIQFRFKNILRRNDYVL